MQATDKNFAIKFINGLKNTAAELEQLRVQLALGKAEAKDAFEELKRKFNLRIIELKADVRITANKNSLSIISAFERLQVQLAWGLAETRDLFENQLKKIRKELNTLEAELKSEDLLRSYAGEIQLEIEKFKAKLELISLHFQLKKVITEYNFQQKKIEFHHKMDELKVKILEKEGLTKDKWNFFKKEIDEAYSHLKRAFIQ